MWSIHKRLFNRINMNTFICIAYKSHYESLNIAKTATHKEIKDAYYRLSMMYHPDKNKGSEEAAKMFRDITAAYEILGNARQRRLYDSGVAGSTLKKSAPYSSPFETNVKSKVPNNTVRSRDYKFDKWSRTHYTNVFQQHNATKEEIYYKKMNEELTTRHTSYISALTAVIVTIALLIFMFNYVHHVIQERKCVEDLRKKLRTKGEF